MAEIDVTDVLLDSDVAGDTFTVVRRQEVVDATGFSSTLDTTIPGVIGAVQPTGDNSLIREDAYDVQAKTLKIITSFRLRGVSASGDTIYKPDQVLWRGDTYEVRVVDDFTLFGGGFIEAECVQVTYVGTAPAPPPNPLAGKLDFSKSQNSALAHGAGAC